MRKIRLVGLALFAVFAFSAVAAASAFAESEWLDNGAVTVAGAVKAELKTEGTERLLLADMKGGIGGGEVDLLCEAKSTGLIGAKVDTVETATATNCVVDTGLCPEPTVTARHLPWKTEILLVGGVFRDDITETAGAGGAPGWLVKCSIVEDECLSNEGFTELTNLAGGGVDVLFNEATSPAATCSRGGAGQGLIQGLLVLLSTEAGLEITVS
jgi:hypothetical protein